MSNARTNANFAVGTTNLPSPEAMESPRPPSAIDPCANVGDDQSQGEGAEPLHCFSANNAREFEAAIHAADAAICVSQKRLRENEMRTSRLLRKPMNKGQFPFHEDESAFNAALNGITAVTRSQSPAFTLSHKPDDIFYWVYNHVREFGNSQREKGHTHERMQYAPRLTHDAALEAFTLMTRLNLLLSAPPQ